MHSQYQRHTQSHLVGCFIQLIGCFITIKQADEPFRAFQQLKVILDGHHKEFIDVDVYELFVIPAIDGFDNL